MGILGQGRLEVNEILQIAFYVNLRLADRVTFRVPLNEG